MSKTFKHSGDLGDIVYSLPAVRALGGGILYLNPEGRPPREYGPNYRTKLNAASIDSITPLLLQQPYIKEVRHWHGEAVDYDLDHYRGHATEMNLSDSHLAAFNLPFTERDGAWLVVDQPIRVPGRPIVISRSVRYQGNHAWWGDNLYQFKDRALFVGMPKEHDIFIYTFEYAVPYYPTPEILTLARVIAGGEQFIGNQNLCRAIAEGLKKRCSVEIFRVMPNTMFLRDGAEYF